MDQGRGVTVTRILHPCVLFRSGATEILVDPCFGEFARRPLTSHVTGIWMPPPGIDPGALGSVAAIALTHGHEDHLDERGMERIPSRSARVIVPSRSIERRVRRLGFERTEVLRPWETARGDGWTLTAVPARAPNARIEISYLIDLGGRRILHAGDTASHRHFEEIRERCRPDAGCLPVSGVSFLGLRLTMTPEEAARAALTLRLKTVVPIHAEMEFRRLSSLVYRASGTETAFAEACRRIAPGTQVVIARRGEPIDLRPFLEGGGGFDYPRRP